MPLDSNLPPSPDQPKADTAPPPLIDAPPPAVVAPLPPPPSAPDPKSTPGRRLLATLLSVFLCLFLADAVISLADAFLTLFFGLHPLSLIGGLVSFLCLMMAILIYALMVLTPLVPKRLFLPLTLFIPAAPLALLPILI
ncbi:MAG: hypothetical protein JWR69_4428, partial [Pedosphaera sp.]|nr:hypothetical protein [Pedosphaera sp.]